MIGVHIMYSNVFNVKPIFDHCKLRGCLPNTLQGIVDSTGTETRQIFCVFCDSKELFVSPITGLPVRSPYVSFTAVIP